MPNTPAQPTNDGLCAQVDALAAENTRLRDQAARRVKLQREWEDRVVSARRRELEERLGAFAELYMGGAVDRVAAPLAAVLYRISQLPDRPGPRQVADLRNAASVLDQLRRHVESPGAFLTRQLAETQRLRAYIHDTGRRLHAASGRDASGCTCDGCLLIIGMDVDGTDEPAPPA